MDDADVWKWAGLVAAFFAGIVAHAAGQWLTDVRHAWEARRKARGEFARVEGLLPELIAEVRADIRADPTVRGIALMGDWVLNSESPVFRYQPSQQGQFQVLENHGYVFEGRLFSNVRSYLMTEEFIRLVAPAPGRWQRFKARAARWRAGLPGNRAKRQ